MAIELMRVRPVSLGRKLAYSVNQLGINIVWQAFNTVAVYYYVSVLGVSGTSISIGMIVYGIVNAFINLFAGYLSDRTRTRWGRRIPYILFGSVPLTLAFYFLFRPPHLGSEGLLAYFLVMTFLFDLCFTFVALNIGALYPEMYQSKGDRSYVSAWQQVFGIVGLIAGVALSKALGMSLGFSLMAGMFALIGLAALYISLYGSFENPEYSEEPLRFRAAVRETFANKRFVVFVVASLLIQLATTLFTSISSFYSRYVVPLDALQSTLSLGVVFIIAIPASFVWARICLRFSTIAASLCATGLYTVMILSFLLLHTPTSVIIAGAFLGVPIAGFLVLLNILLADIIDFDAVTTGRRREGMYLGMNGFIVRIGMSVQYGIMAIFFAISGYNAHANVQSVGTIHGFRFLMGGLPALVVGLAWFALYRYRAYIRVSP